MENYATEQEKSSDETQGVLQKTVGHGTRYPGVHSFRAGRTAGNMAWKHAGHQRPAATNWTSSNCTTPTPHPKSRPTKTSGCAATAKAVRSPNRARPSCRDIDYGLKLKDKTRLRGQSIGRTDRLRTSCRRDRADAGRVRHLAAARDDQKTFPRRPAAGQECEAGRDPLATPARAPTSPSPFWKGRD